MQEIILEVLDRCNALGLWFYNIYRGTPVARQAHRIGIKASLLFQEAYDFAPESWRKKYQVRKLRHIMGIAAPIPLYRHVWGGLDFNKLVQDEIQEPLMLLRSLPVISKFDLQRHWPNGLASQSISADRQLINISSGSTGSPTKFFADAKFSPWWVSSYYRTFLWAGVSPNQGKIHVQSPWSSPRPWPHPLQVHRIPWTHLYQKNKHASVLRFLTKHRVGIIEGFPSQLAELTKIILTNQVIMQTFAVATWYGETIKQSEYELIDRVFGPNITSYYGINELGYLGSMCENRHGYHIHGSGYIMEILDQNDKPVNVGERGKIVITAWFNEVMPLIRYDTGDIGRILSERCSCGRTTPRLEVDGRKDDMIVLPSGRQIHPSTFHSIFYQFVGEILQYQVRYEGSEKIFVRIVPSPIWSGGTKEKLIKALQIIFGRNQKVIIKIVRQIPPLRSGKFKSIVNINSVYAPQKTSDTIYRK